MLNSVMCLSEKKNKEEIFMPRHHNWGVAKKLTPHLNKSRNENVSDHERESTPTTTASTSSTTPPLFTY